MKFTKMHGIGNDYVYVNGFEEKIEDPKKTAIYVSDRHFGIGSDGLIIIKPSKIADCEMEMYNADGSKGEMCGNGIRCVAKFVYDKGICKKEELTVATGAGIKKLRLTIEDGECKYIRVNMGAPELICKKIPVIFSKEKMIDEPLVIDENSYNVTAVSMGNPHCVTFLNEDITNLNLPEIGPKFENNPIFPNRVNTEFVNIIDRKNMSMRVWERGSGETFACGTGACAVAVAGVLNNLTDDEVTIHLLGGDLHIKYDSDDGNVYMTGEATTVFEGEIVLNI